MTLSVWAVNVWFQTIRSPEGGRAAVLAFVRKMYLWIGLRESFLFHCAAPASFPLQVNRNGIKNSFVPFNYKTLEQLAVSEPCEKRDSVARDNRREKEHTIL